MNRKIKSLCFENQITRDLASKRTLLEKEFYTGVRKDFSRTNRKKMLLYARTNEPGISRYRIIKSMNYRPDHEFSLETLALVETYELNFEGSDFWADYLKLTFPGNSLGYSIKKVKEGRKNKNWGISLQGSREILKMDHENTFALTTEAISYFHLGDKKRAIDSWSRIEDIQSIPENEVVLFCRTLYNLRMFDEVVNLAYLISEGKGENYDI